MLLLTSHQSRRLDNLSIKRDHVPERKLMENAGSAVFEILLKEYKPHRRSPVYVFCGPGNNGGDGLVVARKLEAKKIPVEIIKPDNFSKICKKKNKPQLIVDALFGTGLSRHVRGKFRRMIRWINAQKVPVISVDIPSGLSADTGDPLGLAVKAQVTATFGFPKIGFFSGRSSEFTGQLHVAPIGFSKKSIQSMTRVVKTHLVTAEEVRGCLKSRKPNVSKREMGHVFTIAGSREMIGAGIMTADAALKAGAGLSTLILPESVFEKIDPSHLEIMYKPLADGDEGFVGQHHLRDVMSLVDRASVVALGPGLGRHLRTIRFVQNFVREYKGPLVIDADGLFAIAQNPSLLKNRQGLTLLTPHEMEFSRFIKKTLPYVSSHRLELVSEFAQKYGAVCLLKGYRSLLAFPDGSVWVNPTGGPAMASAGQGDVLTGIYAGLLAQFPPSPFGERAGVRGRSPLLFGCFLHGLVGDLLAQKGQRVVMAGDIAKNLSLGYAFLQKKSEILSTVFY